MTQERWPARTRVALVHDFLVDVRGAERVFLAMCDMFPAADLFTAVYDEAGTEGRFAHRRLHTSFLQTLRPSARTFRSLLPFYPSAMESLELRGYDLVLSSSSAWAHGVIPDERAVHVCYCHNPFRYAWNAREETLATRGPVERAALGMIFQRWRQWDWIAAQRVDAYVANSETTRRRVARYFGREASVLHPPVETGRFAPGPVGDAYVVLSELMPDKRIDVAVQAFDELRLPLVVIGNGPEFRRLRRLAGPTVTFTGRVSDADAAALLSAARALVVTATEEFGIAAVEAQAAGRPVIALGEGGVCETVIEGETGTFYAEPEPAALAAAVLRFDPLAVDPRRASRTRGASTSRTSATGCAASSTARSQASGETDRCYDAGRRDGRRGWRGRRRAQHGRRAPAGRDPGNVSARGRTARSRRSRARTGSGGRSLRRRRR